MAKVMEAEVFVSVSSVSVLAVGGWITLATVAGVNSVNTAVYHLNHPYTPLPSPHIHPPGSVVSVISVTVVAI